MANEGDSDMWKNVVAGLASESLQVSSDSFSSEESYGLQTSSDDEGVLLEHFAQRLRSNNECDLEQFVKEMDAWSDVAFKRHMRISRRIADVLFDDMLTSDFIPPRRGGRKQLTAKCCLYIFLWFLANTEPLRTIANRFKTSITSIHRVLHRVVSWLLPKSNIVIKWPQGDELFFERQRFFGKQGFPHVIGAIDSTHIKIIKPLGNAVHYCNRKSYYSINLLAVVDSRTRFTYIHCGEPGSLHDARVLRRSSLHRVAEERKETLFPNNTILIGDSAYPTRPWLIMPYRDNGRLTNAQRRFNFALSSTRMAVERAFGLLKGRFRRIKFFNEYRTLGFIRDITTCACILHNYCINDNDELLEPYEDHPIDEHEYLTGPARREQILRYIVEHVQ